MRCYGKTCWGNRLGTHWELKGHIMGKHWECGEKEKENPSPPHPHFPKLRRKKKARHLECMLGASHLVHEISLPKKSSSPFLACANTLCKQHLAYSSLFFYCPNFRLYYFSTKVATIFKPKKSVVGICFLALKKQLTQMIHYHLIKLYYYV